VRAALEELGLEAGRESGDIAGGVRIAADPDLRGTVLRYKADRGPVAYVVVAFVLRLGFWALATPLVCALNRVYDLVLALQAGVAPYGWVLHHNLGHHVNYLRQPPHRNADESRWKRPNGKQMGRLEYTLDLLAHYQIDIVRVGLRHPRYFRAFLLMKLPLWGLIGLGLWLRPLETTLVFLLPAFLTLVHTIWATYEHHAGCDGADHFDASRNRENRIFNALTGNLGLHSAHHKRPGLHWSLLPELHARIRSRIPEEQILKTFW
jgi:fatty acid desaturase